jgi:hypothetical protein
MMPGISVQSPVDNRRFYVKQVLRSGSTPSHDPSRNMEPIQTMLAFLPKPGAYHTSQSIFAIRQDPQIRVLSSTAASENGLHPPLCIRIQVPHHGECLAAALRCLDAPGENSN